MNRDRIGRSLLPWIALLLLLVIAAGCDPAPSNVLLPGTGERITPAIASISGVVSIPGAPTPYPAIRVYALRDADSTCVSQFNTIQVLGNYTDPEFSVGDTPAMVRLLGCVWVDSVYFDPANFARTPGILQWKFVTNRSFDNPPDYGKDGDQVDGLEGDVQSGAAGDAGNLKADVTKAGPYLALLDEQRARYSILPWDVAPVGEVDRQTGAFTVDKLRDGTYTLIFRGTGLSLRVPGIVIVGGAQLDIGTVSIQQPGGLKGTVSFAGSPPAGLKAYVHVFEAGTANQAAFDSTTSAWQFDGLQPGSYDIRFSATGYTDTVRTAAVVPAQTTDIGDTRLRPGFQSQFTKIQVVGNLNEAKYGNFVIATSPNMTQASPGVWKATLEGITGGNHLWKFVTNGAFDSPQDYGSDEVCRTDLTGQVRLVTGTGTAICVTFPAGTADYDFTLDEIALTYTLVRKGTAGQGAINGTITFGSTSGPPFPAATIRLQTQAGTSDIGTAKSSTTNGAFSFTQLDAGTYKVIASANCYASVTVQNITVGTTTVNLNPISLAAVPSTFNFIQLAGTFNNFDLGTAPRMTQVSSCVWADTLLITSVASPVEFKFVTDGAYDTPADYGVPGTQMDPLSGPVTLGANGEGGNIKVQLPNAGNYRFELNERLLTYTITALGTAAPSRPGN